MTSPTPIAAADLAPYQQQLVDLLEPVLARMDAGRVAAGSGLVARRTRGGWALTLAVVPRPKGVPGLFLSAGRTRCSVALANSEVLECNCPAADPGVVNQVIALVLRYLSGATVVEHRNRRGQIVRADYFYGLHSQADPTQKIGSDRFLLVFPRAIAQTMMRTHRFLQDEGAAEQADAADEATAG